MLPFDPDIMGVWAGFDTYLMDWGWPLKLEDYERISWPFGIGQRKDTGGAEVRSADWQVSPGPAAMREELCRRDLGDSLDTGPSYLGLNNIF